MDISIPYYEDNSRISNSNIGWFLNKGPAYLHKMLTDPPPEEKNPVLERGSMIHMFILQPEEFRKTYVVWDKSRPSSAQQEKFCQALVSSLELEPNRAILSAYKEAYSTTGKSEDFMLSEGLKIASTLKDYINFLKERDERIMIRPYEYQMLYAIKYNILNHKLAWKIIGGGQDYWKHPEKGIEQTEDIKHYHEFHINWIRKVYSRCRSNVNCKSLLDGLTLDFKNQKAIIYDLKTTQKLWNFEESIDQYDYCRQLCYYRMAVEWYLENECGVDDPEQNWDFEFYIIGIDTTGSYEIRVFKIDPCDVESKWDVIDDVLGEIAWHQKTGKWDHSREYYEGDGSESLNL